MKVLLVIALLLGTVAAHAADYPRDITFSWVNSSEYLDGSLIEPGDLTEVRLVCLRNGQPAFEAVFPANGEGLAQEATLTGGIDVPGLYTCVGISIMFDGTESQASNEVETKYIGKPKPPALN